MEPKDEVVNPYLVDENKSIMGIMYGNRTNYLGDIKEIELSKEILSFYEKRFMPEDMQKYYKEMKRKFFELPTEEERQFIIRDLLISGVFAFWASEFEDYEFRFKGAKYLVKYAEDLKKQISKKKK